MNISFETSVVILSGIVSVGGFIITAAVMLKSNKQTFKSLKDHIDTGIEKLELKIGNLERVFGLEISGVKDDIKDIDDTISGVKDQLKSEIYPRLNTVERLSEKNCKILEMHMKECDRRHSA